MQRVLSGSEEAAKQLFDGYAPYLLSAIRRRLGRRIRSTFDTQDFAQDVWASFFAEAPRNRVFDSPAALVGFLTVLARNKVVDAARQRTQTQKRDINREQSLDDSRRFNKAILIGNDPTPSQVLMTQEEWGAFLGKQPPVYRRVLILLRAGKSQIEIAKELGVHPRTVHAHCRPTRPGGDLMNFTENLSGVAAEPAVANAAADLSEMRLQPSGLVDQAYEEFCARLDRGEAINPDHFCAQFPALQSRLGRLLQAHLFLEENPALLGEPAQVCWPECGQRFLDFQLVLELGRGAFARVFLATQPKLGGRLVALKVAWHGGAEAEILGRLHHPNIVPVHSADTDPDTGLTAVCMPYLGSATLRDVIEKLSAQPATPTDARFILKAAGNLAHPLDPSAHPAGPASILQGGVYADGVRTIAVQLADALAFLHERGIYHQDLKPSNVLMTPDGTPMLLDFNLCADARATALLGGTLPYMAPELLQGHAERSATLAADARTDIFSLGVILFELATGTHPFGPIPPRMSAAESRGMLLERMCGGAPDPCRLNPGIEKSLGQLIQRCLSWRAHERPASAAAIDAALRRELRPTARAWRFLGRHPKCLAAAFSLLAFLGIAAVAINAARPPLTKRQFDVGVQLHQQGRFKDAVAQFTAILEADPQNADAFLARARAFQEMGAADQRQFQSALADYQEADRLASDARTKASIGYCLNQTGADPRFAIANYQAAHALGYDSAGLFNNLGYSQLKISKTAGAEASLDRAIELDPRLQAPHHNRAILHVQKATRLPPAKANEDDLKKWRADIATSVQAGIRDITFAIKLGPASAEIYFDAARLHALAAETDPSQKEAALSYLQKAVALKFDTRKLAHDPTFSAVAGDATFQQLQKTPAPDEAPPRAVRVVNPVTNAIR